MQKLYKACLGSNEDYSELKVLFKDIFGDSQKSIDNFFINTVIPENIICVRKGNEIVSALYIIECQLYAFGRLYSSAYVYAVGTCEECRGKGLMREAFEYLFAVAKERGYSYLMLVPQTEKLFSMYEKLGFKTCMTVKPVDVHWLCGVKIGTVYDGCCSYELYKKRKIRGCSNVPCVILGERGYSSFFNPAENSIRVIHSEEGYCVYEILDDYVIIHEIFGSKNVFYNAVFNDTDLSRMYVREPSDGGGVPFGMIKSLDGSPEFQNIFFGIPYGG